LDAADDGSISSHVKIVASTMIFQHFLYHGKLSSEDKLNTKLFSRNKVSAYFDRSEQIEKETKTCEQH